MKRALGIALSVALAVSFGVNAQGGKDKKAGDKAKDSLILYHWWTAGGEKEAIDSLTKMYKAKYPATTITENPIAGGGGGVMRGQIKTMVMAGKAPDTFQLTYGTGMLASFAEILEPIDDLAKDFPIPPMVREMGSINGHLVAIPLNLMRVNCLWYNKRIIDEVGVKTEFAGFDDFYAACEKLKTAGYIPYSVGVGGGQQFWWAHIAEQAVLGAPHGGPGYLAKLYTGKADPKNDPAIREMFEFIKTIKDRGYINKDYNALTWDQASDLLMTNKAAFFQMGDWVKGHFTAGGWKPQKDFDYSTSPGTAGVFGLHFDSFCLVKGAPNVENVKNWLKMLTTVEAQNAFCVLKGAAPVRLDAPLDGYDEITKTSLKAFRDPKTKIVQDAWALPPEAWLGMIGDVFSAYAEKTDIELGIGEYAAAYKKVFSK